MNVATVILAAGASTRLGEPKQLLRYNGQTLVRRVAETALLLRAGPVVAVLGANADLIQAELADLPVQTILNERWPDGLSSSLRVGLWALPAETIEAFLILLTDQPYVTTDLLRQLIDVRRQTSRGIVACRYAEAALPGVPALFDIRYKPEFQYLTGDTGARKLLQHYASDCAEVPFPLAAIDLDTPQDVKNWRSI